MNYNWMKVKEFPPVYNQVKNNIIRNSRGKNPELVKLFMDAFEEFVCQSLKLRYITKSNLNVILARLSRISRVDYLMEPFRGKDSSSANYKTYKIINKRLKSKDRSAILINPNLSNDDKIFGIFKELSKISSTYDQNLTKSVSHAYLNGQDYLKADSDLKLVYLDLGFRLIEDGINLDVAENIYASYKNVPRPTKKLSQESHVFGKKISFLSNFRQRQSFQELTTLIGRKVLTDGLNSSDDQILYDLAKFSWKEGFTKDFINSLFSVFGKEKMFEIIGKLGIIYKREMDSTKSILNISPFLRVTHAKRAFKDIYSILNVTQNKVVRDVSFATPNQTTVLKKVS